MRTAVNRCPFTVFRRELNPGRSSGNGESEAMSRCNKCLYFQNDPKAIEAAFPGLTILGSAYSSSRGDAGICERRDLFLVPVEQCDDFVEKESESLAGGVPTRGRR